jgi:hypothetical protein
MQHIQALQGVLYIVPDHAVRSQGFLAYNMPGPSLEIVGRVLRLRWFAAGGEGILALVPSTELRFMMLGVLGGKFSGCWMLRHPLVLARPKLCRIPRTLPLD